jgi:hypothetical protein
MALLLIDYPLEINSETENLKENDPKRFNRLAKTSQIKPYLLNKTQSNIRYSKISYNIFKDETVKLTMKRNCPI